MDTAESHDLLNTSMPLMGGKVLEIYPKLNHCTTEHTLRGGGVENKYHENDAVKTKIALRIFE